MDETDCIAVYDRGGDVLGVVGATAAVETGPWGMAVVGVAIDAGVERVGDWACSGFGATVGDTSTGTDSGSSQGAD